MGHLVQMAGLAVQNFVSAAVGIAVAFALVRGFARTRTDRLGNFWVDLTRICLRMLLPIAVVGAIVFVAAGMVQNLSGGTDVHHAGRRHPAHHRRPGRQPGGHQGARHQRRRLLQRQLRPPVREPDALDELARDLPAAGDPVQPAADVRPDGRRQPAGLRDRRRDGRPRGRQRRRGQRRCSSQHGGTVPQAVGAATEGKETRFGVPQSATFAVGDHADLDRRGRLASTTPTPPLGGWSRCVNMMLGEVAPGGTGSGLYGMLVLAIDHGVRRGSDGRAARRSTSARRSARGRSSSRRCTS